MAVVTQDLRFNSYSLFFKLINLGPRAALIRQFPLLQQKSWDSSNTTLFHLKNQAEHWHTIVLKSWWLKVFSRLASKVTALKNLLRFWWCFQIQIDLHHKSECQAKNIPFLHIAWQRNPWFRTNCYASMTGRAWEVGPAGTLFRCPRPKKHLSVCY